MWRLVSFVLVLLISAPVSAVDYYWSISSGNTQYPTFSEACEGFITNGNNFHHVEFNTESSYGCYDDFIPSGRYLFNVYRFGDSCPAGQSYNSETGGCDSDCPTGQVWNEQTFQCEVPDQCNEHIPGSELVGNQCLCKTSGEAIVRNGVGGEAQCQAPQGDCDAQSSDVAFFENGQAYCNNQFCDEGQKAAAVASESYPGQIVCIAEIEKKPDTDNDGIPDDQDDDIDGDGQTNDVDNDKDGDGVDNDKDTDPNGKEAVKKAGISASCNLPPTCSGDAIQCAMLRQSWLNACLSRASVSGGDSCSSPPSCSGDSFKCSLIHSQWLARCKVEHSSNELNSAAGQFDSFGDADSYGQTGALDYGQIDIQSQVGDYLNQTGAGGSCPSDLSANFSIGPIVVSYQPFCDLAQKMAPFLLLVFGLISTRIVAQAFIGG